ncbi:MAG: flavin reductase family protein [Gordonia sp. (in: high G+C Gram-positive bacteria)]|uniref:flavin reductase family protein n=1 Tax=Gordonia sp. (in: high G+C Gram-positive bacteria) TaxID=84139 RepID=UPI003BB5AD2E
MNPDTPLDAAADPAALKRAYSCFPSGVVAVCRQQSTGEHVGMSASAFTTVSLDPPLVSICVRRESTTWPQLRDAELGISVFATDQGAAARQLAGPPADRFTGWRPLVEPSGALFIPGAAAHLVCTVASEIPGGDHTVVLLQIHALRSDPGVDPLVFHASTFRALEARRG